MAQDQNGACTACAILVLAGPRFCVYRMLLPQNHFFGKTPDLCALFPVSTRKKYHPVPFCPHQCFFSDI